MWWIWIVLIGILIFVVGFMVLFIKGSDSRRTSEWARRIEDDEQEKAVTEMIKRKRRNSGHI